MPNYLCLRWRVYLRPLADGTKLRAMRSHPAVCSEVEHIDDLTHWQSVIAWGTFEELHGADAEAGMRVLMNRPLPLMVSETSQPPHPVHHTDTPGRQASVYRIGPSERTGRFEKR